MPVYMPVPPMVVTADAATTAPQAASPVIVVART
jgi:hypothetical protein